MRYVVHQDGSGYPVGIHSPTGKYYDPRFSKNQETYGTNIVNGFEGKSTWDDRVDRISAITPNNRARFVDMSDSSTDMSDVLSRQQSQYSQDELNS